MSSSTIERIASLASLLDDALQEKLWEYAELLYVQQVAFDDTDPNIYAAQIDGATWGVCDEWR